MLAMGLLFNRHDPRSDFFNPVINRMTDSGLTDKIFRNATLSAARSLNLRDGSSSGNKSDEPLILEHFYIPMWYFSAGIALAVLAWIAEHVKVDKY